MIAQNDEKDKSLRLFLEAENKVPQTDSSDLLQDIAVAEAQAGLLDKALRLVDKIVSREKDSHDTSNSTLCEISKGTIERGDVETAKRIAMRIDDDTIHCEVLAQIAVVCNKHGDTDTANSILKEAWALAVSDDNKNTQIRSFHAIVRTITPGMRASAQEIANELDVLVETPPQCWLGISAWTYVGDVQAFQRSVDEYEDERHMRLFAEDFNCALAAAQANAGLLDKAKQTANGAVASSGYKIMAAIIAREFERAGRLDEALQMAETIPDKDNDGGYYYIHVVLDVARDYYDQGDKARAQELLDKVVSVHGLPMRCPRFSGVRHIFGGSCDVHEPIIGPKMSQTPAREQLRQSLPNGA